MASQSKHFHFLKLKSYAEINGFDLLESTGSCTSNRARSVSGAPPICSGEDSPKTSVRHRSDLRNSNNWPKTTDMSFWKPSGWERITSTGSGTSNQAWSVSGHLLNCSAKDSPNPPASLHPPLPPLASRPALPRQRSCWPRTVQKTSHQIVCPAVNQSLKAAWLRTTTSTRSICRQKKNSPMHRLPECRNDEKSQ